MNYTILDKEFDDIIQISKEYGAEQVILFGSCLEDPKHARDIDIAVKGIPENNFFKYYGKVSSRLSNPVDIVDFNDLRDHFKQRILRKGKILYETSSE